MVVMAVVVAHNSQFPVPQPLSSQLPVADLAAGGLYSLAPLVTRAPRLLFMVAPDVVHVALLRVILFSGGVPLPAHHSWLWPWLPLRRILYL